MTSATGLGRSQAEITVLVADSQLLMADALATSLSLRPEFLVLEDRPVSGQAAIECVLKYSPDVALIDFWIRGMEGPAVVRSIRAKAPGQKVLLLAWFLTPHQVNRSLSAGATAYVPKNLEVSRVAEIVREAHNRQPPAGARAKFPKPDLADLDPLAGLAALTPREIEILRRLRLEGRADILASQLGISERTMRNHIYNITSKTGTGSHLEAVALARRHGFI